ncbi:MAG: recombinase family protein [Pseudomonadota bacterium]|nr:recombinase family protein [Pseudomonadota bacterium]
MCYSPRGSSHCATVRRAGRAGPFGRVRTRPQAQGALDGRCRAARLPRRDSQAVGGEGEAVLVRLIFERYLELGSQPALQRELRERGNRTRFRQLASGKIIGDVPLTNVPLAYILKNRLYLGELNHRGMSYPGDHEAIIPVDLVKAMQRKLAENLNRRDTRRSRSAHRPAPAV